MMTDRQRFAIENHCRFAFETAHPRYGFLDAGGKASVVLTVNSGWE